MNTKKKLEFMKAIREGRTSFTAIDPEYEYKELVKKFDGEVNTLDIGSNESIKPFNPLDPINKGNELTIFGVSIGTLEKLKAGGFKDLKEVEELVKRFDVGGFEGFELKDTFVNWYRKDGTKQGLLQLIAELGL